MMNETTLETITLGGGCFWCLEPVFAALQGVQDAVVGYAGGARPNPNYQQVCTGTTGHAEVVQVTFDPRVIPLRQVLEVFFSIHDPTTLNRQGADVGSQYRSIILYHSEEQRATADALIAELTPRGSGDAPIVTEVVPLEAFYEAEEYHQEYFEKNPWAGYCQVVIQPKVSKFRKNFSALLKESAM